MYILMTLCDLCVACWIWGLIIVIKDSIGSKEKRKLYKLIKERNKNKKKESYKITSADKLYFKNFLFIVCRDLAVFDPKSHSIVLTPYNLSNYISKFNRVYKDIKFPLEINHIEKYNYFLILSSSYNKKLIKKVDRQIDFCDVRYYEDNYINDPDKKILKISISLNLNFKED